MDPLTGVAAAALTAEGVRFLYQQAAEFLTAWRGRRRGADGAAPRALPAPAGVTVGPASPLADPPDDAVEDTLAELRDMLEDIVAGRMSMNDQAALTVIGDTRALLEALLRAPITLAGETGRPATIAGVKVIAQDVEGRVTGVRANFENVREVRDVHVQADKVHKDAEVTGVDGT